MIMIVDGTADNIDGVMRIMTDAFDPAFGEAWTRNQLLSAITVSNTRLLLALAEDDIVGFALTRTIIDETELLMIGVHRKSQRKAIASQLLIEIINFEIADRRSRIFLEVRSNNHAKQFYEKIGFLEVGCRKNYYRGANNEQFDAVTMAYCIEKKTISER